MTTTIQEQNKGAPIDIEESVFQRYKSVTQIGRKYNYTTVHIYRLIKDKKIERQIIGGVTFIDESKLPDWFKLKANNV